MKAWLKIALGNAITFSDVTKKLRTTFETFTDRRTGKNTNDTMTDAGLSAFSVFFMQSPSFLDCQLTMQETQRKNNTQKPYLVLYLVLSKFRQIITCAVYSMPSNWQRCIRYLILSLTVFNMRASSIPFLR